MLGLSQLLLSPGSLWLIESFVLIRWFQSRCSQNTCSANPLATNLTRTLTLCGDRSAIHPADELNFDIREQHKDSDA